MAYALNISDIQHVKELCLPTIMLSQTADCM